VYQQFGFAIIGAVVEAHGVAFQPMRLNVDPEPSNE
jgi:hypothetical protein